MGWTEFKAIVASLTLSIKMYEDNFYYRLSAVDGPYTYSCIIKKADLNPLDSEGNPLPPETPSADQVDFETNYKANANKNINQLDTDGAMIVRVKAAKKGWHSEFHAVTWTTSTLASVYNKDIAGNDKGFTTLKFYDADNVELTSDLSTCVKTVLTWEPNYDYEIAGAKIYQKAVAPANSLLYVIAVPDIPAIYGGSIPFCEGGIDLSFLPAFSDVNLDGRVTKLMNYSPSYHTNKFQVTLKHNAGIQHSLSFIVELFRL